MEKLKWSYKVLRSVIFTVVLVAVGLFALIYITLSLPPVQNYIKNRTQKELQQFLGSRVEIGDLTIIPLNEVIVKDAAFYDMDGEKFLDVKRLGAGINVWRLIFGGKIEITHIELIDFDAKIYQKEEGAPLNIAYAIDKFKSKDPNKPPTKFDLKIHNVVIREGDLTFDKRWKQPSDDGRFDPNHIDISSLSADVTLPRLKNDDIEIDLRRLSFTEKSGLQVKEIGALVKVTPEEIEVGKLNIVLPETELNFKDFSIPQSLFAHKEGEPLPELKPIDITLYDSHITPSDLSAFYPKLAFLNFTLPIRLTLSGSPDALELSDFKLGSVNNGFAMELSGMVTDFLNTSDLTLDLYNLNIKGGNRLGEMIKAMFPDTQDNNLLNTILQSLDDVTLILTGQYDRKSGAISMSADISTGNGKIELKTGGMTDGESFYGDIDLKIPTFNFRDLPVGIPLEGIAQAHINFDGRILMKDIESSSGTVVFSLGELNFNDRTISDISGVVTADKRNIALGLEINDNDLSASLEAIAHLEGPDSKWDLFAQLNDFDTYNSLLSETKTEGYELSGTLEAHATGNAIDNITGSLEVKDFSVVKGNGKSLTVDNLNLAVTEEGDGIKDITLRSGIADLNFSGRYRLSSLPAMVKETMGEVCPSIFPPYRAGADFGHAEFDIEIKDATQIIDFFNLPIIPLTTLTIDGNVDSETNKILVATNIPYIQQGTNKLITDTYLDIDIEGKSSEATVKLGTVYPTKKGLLKLDLDLAGKNGVYDLLIDLNRGRDVVFYGEIPIRITLDKDERDGGLEIQAKWLPGSLHVNDQIWAIEESEMIFDREGLWVKDFCIRHAGQFLFISGHNTKQGEGDINVTLSDINLDDLFETLNIPNVNFGGNATGGAIARGIFTSDPDVQTQGLTVKNLSYNGAVVGDGDIFGRLNLPEKMIAIQAKINEKGLRVADVDGGVWFGRDSLAFNFDAKSVNIGFMQPFMKAFSSDVKGRASGKATLYGNFSNIDMTGTIVAEDASILIDYINAYYTGSDTVYMTPGRIDIPEFHIKDKYDNTAVVNGVLTHRQFHEPVFKFTVDRMEHLLVYDTNSGINPLWYGKIFASGAGEVNGKPGSVNILADVQTEKGSDFTFVLSDQQEAVKSHFLTFTDKRKEAMLKESAKDTVPDFLKRFYQTHSNGVETSDIYTMDFRVSVTPDIQFNLIMDPVGGDKITAWGDGAMNMTYTSLTDELRIYGKYILEKGNYNFTLQDIILKDFTIKPGSSIAFTGDPYEGILDITAAYRVNTSLTELDQSFASDRELNRTSVPVEALLKVTGPLTSPHIGFDIDLPTVTEETAQKVRSIISTDDMMSRQVLFLVALNKFYPPEYMPTSYSGGEWASIASSTISSQIQNAIGQITDKFTLAPSIRSDKGDFSDIEVDVALSSQLFNNRLLINGNLGYRDPSNSSTTFVGDFDIEYLLTPKGNWRLKAYNHFNDQNYYLKSALTTQGLGIIWRKEFGKPAAPKTKENDRETEVEIEVDEQEK